MFRRPTVCYTSPKKVTKEVQLNKPYLKLSELSQLDANEYLQFKERLNELYSNRELSNHV